VFVRFLETSSFSILKEHTQAIYESSVLATGASFVPTLEPKDICRKCVEEVFLGEFMVSILRFRDRDNVIIAIPEKLYQYEHPRNVAQFDAIVNEANSLGYWISRHWVKGAYHPSDEC
jgi:hypothetical protein